MGDAHTIEESTDGGSESANRRAAERIALALRAAGHTTYFAGGCVRDRLRGEEPKDHDIASSATPEQIGALFANTRGVGQQFGVILVNLLGESIEVATFRSDGPYTDARRPDSVTFSGAEEDAQRRDFTINGLFEDPETGEVIDFVGGRDDLEEGIIRAIGNAEHRIQEDRLRMVRAVRFAARFDFRIEEATAQAIHSGAATLEGVSRERIGQEVELMLTPATRATAVRLIEEFGLDAYVVLEPHIVSSGGTIDQLPPPVGYPLALAAWWRDRRRTEPTSVAHSLGRWRDALVMSNATFGLFRSILRIHNRLLAEWNDLAVAARKRLASKPAFRDALSLLRAEDERRACEIEAEVDELSQTGLAPDPLIGGSDLIKMDLAPGPVFSKILREVYDAQLEQRIGSRIEAEALARRLLAKRDS